MVVNKGWYGYYVIQSSNKNPIGAYGRKRQKRRGKSENLSRNCVIAVITNGRKMNLINHVPGRKEAMKEGRMKGKKEGSTL